MAKVLLVDDEVDIRRVLRRLIERRFPGVEVAEAESAERALELVDRGGFDVVVADYRMEGATGAHLLRHVAKASPTTARVLATGYADDADVEDDLRTLDVHARLPKPWENAMVVQTFESLLAARRGGKSP